MENVAEIHPQPSPTPGEKQPGGGSRSERHKSDGNASFLRAARAGNLEKVLEYLKGSTDINTSNANGLNALHLSSKEGHVNIVTELLKRGASVDAATKKGNTALHIASLAGQEEIVKILVQHNAKVNIQSQNGFTPLYMAAQENHANVVRFLLTNGANQALATEDGFTPLAVALQQEHDKVVAVLLENDTRGGKVRLPALHIAAKKDDTKAATLLLQNEHNVDTTSKSGSLVNDTTKSGFTPLHIAAHYGNVNVGALLLEKGGDPNYKARNAITPLHVASKWGRSNMVSVLLEHGGKIDVQTRDGLTPLHCGARSGHEPVVELLLEKGAPVTDKTKNGLTPLHMAAQGDHMECARMLIYHHAPIDDVTVDYLTPLHVAAHCGNVRTAKLLLDRKCEVNARALNGFTPLHIACKKNRIKVVELLLKYGASIEATTESGLTPLHVASFMGHMNIVLYLIQHGANPDTPTVRGETALHLAARANQTDIIRILLRNNAQVDAKAREQQTPLHIAARLGNVDNVVLLLQNGASPDAATKDLYTPLHIAAKEGHEEVAAVLLEHGASQNLTTKKGFTPLHIAAKYGNIKVARLLLQQDADPNIQGKNGLTPLHVATHYNHVNVALLLLENGASPHCTAKNGYTPLHIAAKKNQMDIATTLLEYGAKPNAESKNGFTPLHLASQEGHTDMVSLLLEHNADVNCKAKNGLTPMHLAAQEDKVPVAEVLVKHGSEIDPQTKAGYTPLHTACHFGQINMIRFLLEHGASVNATTKLGYTPLHQAAQQGHVLVINLLLKYKASPNAVTNTGQTPLSIAQRLGYISVVEILKHITEVTTTATDEKYKVVSPETMQETLMTDSEDEGGEDNLESGISIDDMKFLADDSIMPKDEFHGMRFSTLTSTSSSYYGQDISQDDIMGEGSAFDSFGEGHEYQLMEKATVAPSLHAALPPPKDDRARYDSYSGLSFASSFDPDNIALDRHPVYSGFLVSFMVDARGGAMRGCRHSGVRIIVPPGKACMPTRVTCKLVKKEKLLHPPPLMEGEALASRILEMGPVGAKFLGPVIIEVPHFASLRGKEREIVILRSDNGETWKEHTVEATEDAIHQALNGSFEGEDLESAEELYNKRITRILTNEFPHYFAVVTRLRQESKSIGPEANMLSSTVVPQVQSVFPEGSLTKKIKVGLQAQPIPPELVSKMLGNRVAVSPIVTVEPRRRKFHKPITVTIPLPKASQKGMINQYGSEAPTLRLLCSITGGTTPAQWEDITGTTPLTFVNDCVSFTTTVSARFWLMDCQNINEAAKMATELYREVIAVPFMAKFVVFAKPAEPQESRLRVFCMTDDKMDKTLEGQEHFIEIARSKDVEVLEGKGQYIEMAGNLVPVTKSGDQLYINFHGFRENRLPFVVRVRDTNQEAVARIAFMKEPKVSRDEVPQTPICNLNIKLPDAVRGTSQVEIDPTAAQELRHKYELARTGIVSDQISKAELRLTDIAENVQGDWVVLARQLEISEDEIVQIQTEYNWVGEQALVMLHIWVQKGAGRATGNELERALTKIRREDVIRKCMYNIEEVTDDIERAVAKTQIDADGFDEFAEELGPSRDSTIERGLSLDVSYDEQDIMKESESVGESSDGGSVDKDEKRVEEVREVERPASMGDDQIIPQVDERHGVIKTPTDEEEREIARQKQEAYMALAAHMQSEVEFEAVVEPPSERYSPVAEDEIAETKREARPVVIDDVTPEMEPRLEMGMDDRDTISLSSEDSLVVQESDKKGEIREKHIRTRTKTPPPTPVEQPDGQEQDVSQEQLAARLALSETWESADGDISAEIAPTDHAGPEMHPLPQPHEVSAAPEFVKEPSPVPQDTIPDEFVTAEAVQAAEQTPIVEAPAPVSAQAPGQEFVKEPSPVTEEQFEEAVLEPEAMLQDEAPTVMALPSPVAEAAPEEFTKEPSPVIDEILPDQVPLAEARPTEEAPTFEPAPVPVAEEAPEELVKEPTPVLAEQELEPTPLPAHVTLEEPTLMMEPPTIEEDEIIAASEEPPAESAPPFELPQSPIDFDEVEEVLPDGTVVRRRIVKTKVKKVITKKIRRVGPDGEVIEDVITEEIPESELSETSSLRSSLSDARDVVSPVPSFGSAADLASPDESVDSDRPSIRVYTDTIEGEPEIETDVQEFEETLPDGTVVKRKVIKTRQKQTVVKRVVMEGPESDLPTSEEQAQLMLDAENQAGEPEMRIYTDHIETEPEQSTSVEEFEETLPDGTVVRKKVVKTTDHQLKTERLLMEGVDHIPGLIEPVEQSDLEQLPATAGALPEAEEDIIEAQQSDRQRVPPPPTPESDDDVYDDDFILVDQQALVESAPPADQPEPVEEEPIVATERKKPETPKQPTDDVISADKAAPSHAEAPPVVYRDADDHLEDMPTSPSALTSEQAREIEEAQEGEEQLVPAEEGDLDEAAGGDLQSTRVVMKKQVHKKTIIKDGKEETIVTEDTHIAQDNEGPEELRDSMQELIDQFMEGGGELAPSDRDQQHHS